MRERDVYSINKEQVETLVVFSSGVCDDEGLFYGKENWIIAEHRSRIANNKIREIMSPLPEHLLFSFTEVQ